MALYYVCSVCGRKRTGKKRGPLSIKDHIRVKHQGVGLVLTEEREEEEESMASRHIQATLDEAMGVENYDREWLI